MGDVSLVGLSGVVLPSNNRLMNHLIVLKSLGLVTVIVFYPTEAKEIIRFFVTFDRGIWKIILLFWSEFISLAEFNPVWKRIVWQLYIHAARMKRELAWIGNYTSMDDDANIYAEVCFAMYWLRGCGYEGATWNPISIPSGRTAEIVIPTIAKYIL